MSDVNDTVNKAVADVATDIALSQVTGKKWYVSKTLWANVVMVGAILLQGPLGFTISLELQALIMAGVNVALRAITKEPIVW